jgi:uncharacterized protein
VSLIWLIVRVVFLAYLIAAITLYALQDRLLLPAPSRLVPLRTGHFTDHDIEPWHPRGVHAGYVVTPVNRRPLGTFIVYHGNAESADDKLALAEVMVRSGYRVVLVEYPGYGERPGSRTMISALHATRAAFADVLIAWPGRIFLAGESLGAGMAAQAVSGNEASIDGVLLITPWDTLANVAAEKLSMFPVRWMLHDQFDSVHALRHYTGPLVVLAAANDTLIPVRHAERLVRLHPGAQLLILPAVGHDDWFNAMTPDLWSRILHSMQAAALGPE